MKSQVNVKANLKVVKKPWMNSEDFFEALKLIRDKNI